MLVKDTIGLAISEALKRAHQDGILSIDTVPDIEVDRPNNPDHGDFATNLPLRLARAARTNPLQLAEAIAERVEVGPEIASVVPAAPGFINFKLSDGWLQRQVELVREEGSNFGATDMAAAARLWSNSSALTRQARSTWVTPAERCWGAPWRTLWKQRGML